VAVTFFHSAFTLSVAFMFITGLVSVVLLLADYLFTMAAHFGLSII
jgi:hypothetical protein